MKPLHLLFAVWLVALGGTVAQSTPAGDNSRNAGGPVVCQQQLMQSYLLKGTEVSNNRTMLLCPTIKKNCCTRHDIQRVFHYSRDVLPAKLAEYKQKMEIMFSQLREVHNELVKDRPLFRGNRRRRNFCARQFRAVLSFDFQTLYNKVQEEWFHMDHFVNEHAQRFFCMLCDGAAHESMVIRVERRAATFHMDYCQDVVRANKDLLRILNVEMLNYMRLVQNVVDCQHYSRSFGLRFPRPDKVRLRNRMVTCLEGLDGARFKVACAPICSEIKFAQIVPLFSGDFDFLHEMVLVFNRFLKYRESGNLISMRLRQFFKRFRVPRSLTRTRRRDFIRNLTPRIPKLHNKKRSSRSLRDLPGPVSAARRVAPLPKAAKHARTVAPMAHTRPGRLLQNSIVTPSVKKLGVKAKLTPVPRPPQFSFDKTLVEFYQEVEIPRNEAPRPTIYRIRGNPMVFDRFEQNWSDDTGIDYTLYTNLRFGMSRRVLYQMLYTYRKPEIPDSRLTIFLMDFPPDFFRAVSSMFNDDFVIMPNNYNSPLVDNSPVDRRRKLAGPSAPKQRHSKH